MRSNSYSHIAQTFRDHNCTYIIEETVRIKIQNAWNILRMLPGSSNCRTSTIIIISEYYILIRAHDQNTVVKWRIGNFLRIRGKSNGSYLDSFNQDIFIKSLLHAKYYSKTLRYRCDQEKKNLRSVTKHFLSGVEGPYFICNNPCFGELNWHVKQWSNVRSRSSKITFSISVNIHLVQSFSKKDKLAVNKYEWLCQRRKNFYWHID